MTKEQAIQFLENMAQNAYKQGTVALTPEAFDVFRKAIEVLRPVEKKKTDKK